MDGEFGCIVVIRNLLINCFKFKNVLNQLIMLRKEDYRFFLFDNKYF